MATLAKRKRLGDSAKARTSKPMTTFEKLNAAKQGKLDELNEALSELGIAPVSITPTSLDGIVSLKNPVPWREFLRERAELVETRRGVEHWRSANQHWIVVDGQVEARFGFNGRVLFNAAVAVKEAESGKRSGSASSASAQTPRGRVLDRQRRAKTVAPRTPRTKAERRLVERHTRNPSRLDREGVDTPPLTSDEGDPFRPRPIPGSIGLRVQAEGRTWEVTGANDLGVPFFSRVVSGRVQKKQFTLEGGKRLVERELERRRSA